MLLAGSSALLSVEIPAIPIKKQETHYDVCLPTGQEEFGFNWGLQPRLTSLSAAFSEVLGYTCLHKLLDLPFSLVRVNLGSVCNLVFSYSRISQGMFCARCHLPKDLSVLFL